MFGSFGAMPRGIGGAPRRGLLRLLAGVGVATLIDAAPSGEGAVAGKRKEKKKGCARCPSPSCPVQFTQAGGGKICSIGSLPPPSCTPCTSSSQCRSISPDFPHCVTAGKALGDPEPTALACDGSPPGECRMAGACVT